MMSKDDRNDLVGDVADALTLDQKVQWERCARLAEGADRAKIENLRVIERVLASRPDAGQGPEAAEATRPYGSTLVGRAVHVLIAIATLEVAATLLLLPGAWGDYYRAHGELAVFMTIQLVGYAASAGLLLWAGRGDWRTWLLGVYCLLKATTRRCTCSRPFSWSCRRRRSLRPFSRTCPQPPGSLVPSTFPRSCSRRPSCGRSPASARASIAGPGSMTWRGA